MQSTHQDGSAILMVLVILVSISLLGISALNITGSEFQITGNFKAYEMTFNVTDGTLNSMTALISHTVSNNDVPESLVDNGLLTSDESTALFNQIIGFDSYISDPDVYVAYGSQATDDITIDNSVDVAVDVQRIGAKAMKGSAVKFSQGGSGFSTGSAITFGISANGIGVQNSQSTLEAVYLNVLGP